MCPTKAAGDIQAGMSTTNLVQWENFVSFNMKIATRHFPKPFVLIVVFG